jgi:hypothetical protein
MISTSFITGTGFMKCMPMKPRAASRAAPMRVMGMDEVLVARIASGLQIAPSSSTKIFFLSSSFSVTASITKSDVGEVGQAAVARDARQR